MSGQGGSSPSVSGADLDSNAGAAQPLVSEPGDLGNYSVRVSSGSREPGVASCVGSGVALQPVSKVAFLTVICGESQRGGAVLEGARLAGATLEIRRWTHGCTAKDCIIDDAI